MYINIETGEVIDFAQLSKLHSNPMVLFPPDVGTEALLEYGYAVLEDDPKPVLKPLETLQPGATREEDGHWYRAWIVIPADPEQVIAAVTSNFEQATQDHLNAAAVAAGYDDISTAVSYAEEPAVPKFQNDGIAFRKWRSLVWAYAYEQLAKVLAGEREQPTVDEFLGELPVLELPA
jgi:hypothetical protein